MTIFNCQLKRVEVSPETIEAQGHKLRNSSHFEWLNSFQKSIDFNQIE